MKKVLLAAAFAAAAIGAGAQVVEVVSVKKVPVSADLAVNTPCISPDGSFAVVSSLTDNALYRVDLSSGASARVVENGSALDLAFAPDGSAIVYKTSSVGKDKLRRWNVESTDLTSGASKRMSQPARHCAAYSVSKEGTLALNADGKMSTRSLVGKKAEAAAPMVSIHYGHLELTTPDGTTTTLDPQGRGSYLWPSVSPDGTRVLYYLAGEGCFSCALDGSDVHPYGYLHGAKWLDNGSVVGFQDFDNGSVVTASAIVAVDAAGQTQTLTDSSLIAINPSVSADGHSIIFSTIDGQLYNITIK